MEKGSTKGRGQNQERAALETEQKVYAA